MLEKDIDEIVNDTQVLMALKTADHFIITFTDIFNVVGRVAKHPTSEAVQ